MAGGQARKAGDIWPHRVRAPGGGAGLREMLRPVWDTVRMRGLGSHLRGGIWGLRKPWIWRQKGGIVRDQAGTTGVNGGAGPGKADRDGREGPGQSPRPAIWVPC